MATEYCFTVNGMRRTTTEKKSLLRYLRDDLHLFSVKDGCSEGACGTCTVIIDGKTTRACIQKLSKLEGKRIQTIEGFTEREKEVLELICKQYSSAEIGEMLSLSARTVDGHRNNLLLKTNSKNMAGLVIFAIQNKIIALEDSSDNIES